MSTSAVATRLLAQETRALLTRLARVKPLVLHEPMVPAAAISPAAQVAIERHLARGRRALRRAGRGYLRWLEGPGRRAAPAEAQHRYTLLRLRFNTVLSHFDLFADALTQRSEHETGVWLSGLDTAASDALALRGYYQAPAVICYLDRGAGAAIRRARTRLPGGGQNPVAVIRVPRERMVGSGIASSLVHEVGHQAAALLGLVYSLRAVLRERRLLDGRSAESPWRFWERWISEIVADFWSVARVGIAATLGLIGVVSLPRAFVFRVNLDDPHPIPWIRVKLSCAMGEALFPHPQWAQLATVWEAFYPLAGLDSGKRRLVERLGDDIPRFAELLADHRPPALRGYSLREAMDLADRQPSRLAAHYGRWRLTPPRMYRTPPALAFAVIGQARADGNISPEEEGNTVAKLLTHWALQSTLDTSAHCMAGAGAPAAVPEDTLAQP